MYVITWPEFCFTTELSLITPDSVHDVNHKNRRFSAQIYNANQSVEVRAIRGDFCLERKIPGMMRPESPNIIIPVIVIALCKTDRLLFGFYCGNRQLWPTAAHSRDKKKKQAGEVPQTRGRTEIAARRTIQRSRQKLP